jgi:hypothetical protein
VTSRSAYLLSSRVADFKREYRAGISRSEDPSLAAYSLLLRLGLLETMGNATFYGSLLGEN